MTQAADWTDNLTKAAIDFARPSGEELAVGLGWWLKDRIGAPVQRVEYDPSTDLVSVIFDDGSASRFSVEAACNAKRSLSDLLTLDPGVKKTGVEEVNPRG